MYGWGDDPSTWYGEKKDYDFDARSKARRERAASRAAARARAGRPVGAQLRSA